MSAHATDPDAIPDVDRTRWRIDPTRPSVEFHANQHRLGMTWNRLGMLRTPSKLIVHGRLVQDGG